MNVQVSSEGLLRDPDFLKLKAYIITVTGLSYYQNKDDDLANRIGRRMAQIGWSSCQNYLNKLGGSSTLGSELDLLVGELTIGETYFFRHTEQFDALRQHIIPALLKNNEGRKSINIWCAGCSTGAEPYSLAILLRREFKLQTQGWAINILGTDINRAFLTRATLGNFDEWHLRSVAPEIKSSCFTKTDKTYQINPEFQSGVNFIHHNLITGPYPPRLEGPLSFDIILCRNVMIYFSHETIAGILPRFETTLSTRGWLLLGYSEINTDLYKAFELVPFPGAMLFQKKEASIKAPLPFPAFVEPKVSAPVFVPPLTPTPTVTPLKATPVPKFEAVSQTKACKSLMDAGDLSGALRLVDQLLKTEELDAGLHFMRGLVLAQLKKDLPSEEAFKKAVYLDRKFVLAHYHLGLHFKAQNASEKSQRYFSNARTLLDSLASDAVLPEGNGMTASQLLHLLKALGEAA